MSGARSGFRYEARDNVKPSAGWTPGEVCCLLLLFKQTMGDYVRSGGLALKQLLQPR